LESLTSKPAENGLKYWCQDETILGLKTRESKVITEKIVKGYTNNWVLIRPTSIWGPWFGEPYLNFFKLVINGLYFNIPEKNASTKTYGYVENSCYQIYSILMAKNEDVTHKCFYIGDEYPINITKWSNLIRLELKKRKLVTLPVFVLKIGSYIGDFLKSKLGFTNFPLNTFRYKNMTTNNIIKSVDVTNTLLIKNDLIDLKEGIRRTLLWINKHK
jgi:nucleoside-diphosphate-sugar epimerase